MSARPTNVKAANKLRKAFRKKLPAFFDLFQWLEDRGYADTQGQARKVILAERVKSESHVVGLVDVTLETPDGKETTRLPERFIPVEQRASLVVLPE